MRSHTTLFQEMHRSHCIWYSPFYGVRFKTWLLELRVSVSQYNAMQFNEGAFWYF